MAESFFYYFVKGIFSLLAGAEDFRTLTIRHNAWDTHFLFLFGSNYPVNTSNFENSLEWYEEHITPWLSAIIFFLHELWMEHITDWWLIITVIHGKKNFKKCNFSAVHFLIKSKRLNWFASNFQRMLTTSTKYKINISNNCRIRSIAVFYVRLNMISKASSFLHYWAVALYRIQSVNVKLTNTIFNVIA